MIDTTLVDLRNAIYDRVQDPATYKTQRKTPLPTLSSAQMPALSVFILGGIGSPDGDANAGNVRMINEETIAISAVRGMEDVEALEVEVESELEVMKTKLFTDPTFVQFYQPYFEGIVRTSRRWLFPQNGDQYVIELRYEMTFRRREIFDIVVTDAFEHLKLTTRPAGKDVNTPAITVEVDPAQ